MKTEQHEIGQATSEEKKSKKFTKEQWITLMLVGCVHFSSAMCYSIQAPFYPKEAESRGATASEYGFVFAIFELVNFLTSPILGKYLHVLGVKTTLNAGMILTAISVICFGLLDYVRAHVAFIALSLIFRIAEAVGSTAAIVSAYSITAAVFPDNIATTLATVEVFFGIGVLVAPTLGELLFSVGGYTVPFCSVGVIVVIIDFFIFLALPPILETTNRSDHVKMRDILKLPSVQVVSVCVFVISISISFITAILEPHIRIYELSPLSTGLVFITSGVVYSITSPIVGRVCDKLLQPRVVMSFGLLLMILAYIILGPTPYLGIPKTLTFCIIGLVVHGIAISVCLIPTLIDLISSSVMAGFSNDVSTLGVISGLWFSVFSLGAFLGPSLSGILYDYVGFQYATLFVIAVNIAMFCGMMIFAAIEKKACKNTKPGLNA